MGIIPISGVTTLLITGRAHFVVSCLLFFPPWSSLKDARQLWQWSCWLKEMDFLLNMRSLVSSAISFFWEVILLYGGLGGDPAAVYYIRNTHVYP